MTTTTPAEIAILRKCHKASDAALLSTIAHWEEKATERKLSSAAARTLAACKLVMSERRA